MGVSKPQGVVENAMNNQAALSTPEEDVNELMQQVAGACPEQTLGLIRQSLRSRCLQPLCS